MRCSIITVCLATTFSAPAVAAEEASQEVVALTVAPVGPQNPRNSEAAIIPRKHCSDLS